MSGRLFGCMSFVTTSVPHNECGSNGLPLTPNSIKVLGLAQELLPLKHKNLCRYVEFKCGKHDRVFAVSEYYLDNLKNKITAPLFGSLPEWYSWCIDVTFGILNALKYLNENSVVHYCLEPQNILLTPDGLPKLSSYGMHYVTAGGKYVDFPLGNPKYSSPEQLVSLFCASADAISYKSDIWSVAVILLEMLHRELIWANEFVEVVVSNVLQLCHCTSSQTVIQNLVRSFQSSTLLENRNEDVLTARHVLENGLAVDQRFRKSPEQFSEDKIFSQFIQNNNSGPDLSNGMLTFNGVEQKNVNPVDDLECDELWYLWKLAGGDMVSEVLKNVTTTASIKKVPVFATSSGELLGLEPSPEALFDPTYTLLSMETIEKRLILTEENVDFIYPLLESEDGSKVEHETSKLPMLIKENDFDYQVYRIALFKRLLMAYPYLRDKLWKEARVDIPPFYRGKIWAGLLDVSGNIEETYLSFDKETPILPDRQIAVDIPRCHQYNAILSSPVAHKKLKRVLKAWLQAHPHLTYWQGLDSLCAIFVHLNFNDEACAFASLSSFINKYLHKFFMKDNSSVIQEYLAVFAHLVAFHDPLLACHLNEINFIPDLYAIPWFLTMFAHVFPIHKVVHLWDTLLLGNSSFPLCIGVAILLQLSAQLRQCDFNECILLFSDLPEIDIEVVVKKSISIFCATPKSSTFRIHAQQSNKHKREPASYYSDDYNSIPKTDLSDMTIPLEELKQEICCRISADDLIQLSELRGTNDSRTPAKATKSSKPRISIIDIRPSEEFVRGSIPCSRNYPFPNNKPATLEPFIKSITQQKPKVVIVVGNNSGKDDKLFAFELLKADQKGVCILHKGISILKPTGVLTVPSQ